MSACPEFWIVAGGCSRGQHADSSEMEKGGFLAELKHSSALSAHGGPWMFNVPDGERSLLFGSFDNLIRLTDDLAKADSQVDSIVHRLERQFLARREGGPQGQVAAPGEVPGGLPQDLAVGRGQVPEDPLHLGEPDAPDERREQA